MNENLPVFANSSQSLHDALAAKVKNGQPGFFSLQAQLPAQGRTNIAMAASENMTVVLKTYASGGENELHTHPGEDHTFIILQGQARFHGPAGEEKIIGANEGVLLPPGAYYWFQVCSEEPLVMLRIGAGSGGDYPFGRIDIDGKEMKGDDPRNKEVPVILTDKWFGRNQDATRNGI